MMSYIVNICRALILRFKLDKYLNRFSKDKLPDSFIVKLLPNHTQYPKKSYRKYTENNINFELDISEYMEYVYYFGILVETKEKVYNLLEKNMVVLDIGVNFGETLLSFAKSVGEGGKVYGFEPVPYIYQKAIKNIQLNNFSNIELKNIAISDKQEKLFFDIVENNNSGGTKMSKNKGGHTIQATTLDSYVFDNKIEQIDVVKIDVEGFEVNVLKGAIEVLSKFKPILFIEVNDDYLGMNGTSAKELVYFLEERNYHLLNANTSEKINSSLDFTNCHFDLLAKAST